MGLSIEEFAARIRAQGAVWGLRDADDAWAMHEDAEDESEAMPVWVDEQAARSCAVGEWAGFAPTALTLAEFTGDWLPALDEEGAWVGINFVADEQGDLVDPVELSELLSVAE